MMGRISLIAVTLLVSLLAGPRCHADLVFTTTLNTPAGGQGDVQVLFFNDAGPGLVRALVQVRTDFAFNSIAGGFGAVAPATFSQNPSGDPLRSSVAVDDTAFFDTSPSALVLGASADTTTELRVEGATNLGGDWRDAGADTFFDFAQLVFPSDGTAITLADDGSAGSIALAGASGVVGNISGTVTQPATAVPEPSQILMLLVSVVLVGSGSYLQRHWRSQQLKQAAELPVLVSP